VFPLQAKRGSAMNIAHPTDRPFHEYQPTIIEYRSLISRLAIQLAFFREELKRSWPEFKNNPVACTRTKTRELLQLLRSSPNVIPVTLAALVAIICAVVMLIAVDRNTRATDRAMIEVNPEIVYMNLTSPREGNDSIGLDGPGRVGFQKDTGEGSGPTPKLANGGGGGGNRDPLPAQQGKLPPPSNIQAAIPTAPPIHTQALPESGMDIDPALWTDLKAPVFGDPKSKSTAESKGSGEGEGIGTNKGLGIGGGDGPGYGPGKDGGIGGEPKDVGCCGRGGGRDIGLPGGGPYRVSEVEQKARILSKPEPQYTEEARKNLLSGRVVLRAIFSSSGEVVQIRAVHTLPFGLTERAIAAARQIQFVPAVKGGQPVSVSMQLEYNFNLY